MILDVATGCHADEGGPRHFPAFALHSSLGSLSFAMQPLKMEPAPPEISAPEISKKIVVIRGQRALLDTDLAELYGVKTLRLNEQVRRNADRFPGDFLFKLTNQEVASLRSHFAILKPGRDNTANIPHWLSRNTAP